MLNVWHSKAQASPSLSFRYSVMSSFGLHAQKAYVLGMKCETILTQDYVFGDRLMARWQSEFLCARQPGCRCGAIQRDAALRHERGLSDPAAQPENFITFPKHPCHHCRLSWGKPELYYLCIQHLHLNTWTEETTKACASTHRIDAPTCRCHA